MAWRSSARWWWRSFSRPRDGGTLPDVPKGHGRDHRHGVPRHAARRGVRLSVEFSGLQKHDALAPAAVRHAALRRPAARLRLPDLGADLRARGRPRTARRHHGDRHRRDRHLHQALFGSDRESGPQADRRHRRGRRQRPAAHALRRSAAGAAHDAVQHALHVRAQRTLGVDPRHRRRRRHRLPARRPAARLRAAGSLHSSSCW